MKKCWTILLIVLCFISVFVFASCNNENPDADSDIVPADDPSPSVFEVRFYVGETQIGETQKISAGSQFVLPADSDVLSDDYSAITGWTVRGGDGTIYAPEDLDKVTKRDLELQAVIGLKPHSAITLEGFNTSFGYLDNYYTGSNEKVKITFEDGTSTYLPQSEYQVVVPSDFGKACKEYEIVVKMNLSDEQIGYKAAVSYNKTHLKVLVIGNSYSDDTIAYVYAIAESLGLTDIEVADLYVGSCSIAQHFDFATHNQAMYLYRYFDKNNTDTDVDILEGTKRTLEYGVKDRDWDYIVLQQNSLYSGMETEYNLLGNLVEYVKERATNPNVKIAFNMTWAYAAKSANASFVNYGNNQMRMYRAIVNAMQKCVVTNPDIACVVPNGTAIQNARTSFVGDNLTRDNFDHLDKTLGRYIAGLTLVRALTGADLSHATFAPAGLTERQIAMAKESATNAVADPFFVTFSQYVD